MWGNIEISDVKRKFSDTYIHTQSSKCNKWPQNWAVKGLKVFQIVNYVNVVQFYNIWLPNIVKLLPIAVRSLWSNISIPSTVRKRSCLHPPARKRRATSGRMRICLAKWCVWKGSPPGTRRRPRGILLWWAHSLFCSLSTSVTKQGSCSLHQLLHTCLCNIWQTWDRWNHR